jgi:hypothetical protein
MHHAEIKKIVIEQFIARVGYAPNIDSPRSFNEKIQWYKLYYRDPLMTTCADKLAVRDYVRETASERYLIPLIAHYADADEIDFATLPEKFVLKLNCGSTTNLICRDKSQLDIAATREIVRRWLRPESNHYNHFFEWCYKDIPSRVTCETFLESDTGDLCDYKFVCFNGKVKYLFVASERATGNLKINFYDTEWTRLPFARGYPPNPIDRSPPQSLGEMIALAEKLAAPFPLVRVDLYEVTGRPFFGELTFYPGNGTEPFSPLEWDYKFGECLSLPASRPLTVRTRSRTASTEREEVPPVDIPATKRGVVYTCITGDYDTVQNHTYVSPDWDYVCFTDKIPANPELYHWRFLPLHYRRLDDARNSRWHKVHPHLLFPNHHTSVWLDANINILNGAIFEDIQRAEQVEARMALGPHFARTNVYDELEACLENSKDELSTLERHRQALLKSGFSGHFGHFFENGIIFRRHHDQTTVDVMADWWWWITHYSRRDQLSLVYVLWEHNLHLPLLNAQSYRSNPGIELTYGRNHASKEELARRIAVLEQERATHAGLLAEKTADGEGQADVIAEQKVLIAQHAAALSEYHIAVRSLQAIVESRRHRLLEAMYRRIARIPGCRGALQRCMDVLWPVLTAVRGKGPTHRR